MKKKILIGIPVKDFINPMSRLKEILELNERIQLQKSLIQNIVSSFKNDERDIFLISNDNNVENFAHELEINVFKTSEKDLNKEVFQFSTLFEQYEAWLICHADLPYINKFVANLFCIEIIENQIIITSSKDNGTPIIGGSINFNNFRFGNNSFLEHKKLLIKNNIEYSQLFLKELSFEIDNPDDYENFLKHKPRWFKKSIN
jgi:2-phospho-L-lactate guanylyltransferase (CobY/MobA/RfbA family)